MKKWIPALVLGLLVTSAAVTARNHMSGFGAPHGMGFGPPNGMGFGMLDFIAEEIGLSVDQEQNINQLINEARLASAVDRERLLQLRQQIGELAAVDEGFDEAGAEVLAGEMAELVARMAVDVAQLRWEIRQVLTPEQREQIEAMRGNMMRSGQFRFVDGHTSEL